MKKPSIESKRQALLIKVSGLSYEMYTALDGVNSGVMADHVYLKLSILVQGELANSPIRRNK